MNKKSETEWTLLSLACLHGALSLAPKGLLELSFLGCMVKTKVSKLGCTLESPGEF